MKQSNVRAKAAQVMNQVVAEGGSLSAVLPPALAQVGSRDRGLLQELCFGALRWYPQLQYLLTRLLKKPLKTGQGEVQALLLLGLYQLLYLRVPDHAAVSEVVSAARALGKTWATGLINGVLRNFQRRRDAWLAELEQDEVARTAHPLWLLRRVQADWPQHWQAVVAANNARPPYSLRVNRLHSTRAAYLERLSAAGIDALPSTVSEVGITLTQAQEPQTLPDFANGAVAVQDIAAQLAADLLDVKPGQRVLDACAAPGGKTCHLLETQPQMALLLALDKDVTRLAQVQDNLTRQGLHAELKVADAASPAIWWDGQQYDRVLLDTPCSATGVIRRHPDIKIRRRITDITALAAQQYNLLTQLWTVLAPNGKLLYATCSILQQENEQVIAAFLSNQADAREIPLTATWGLGRTHGRQILPGELGMDGFYYACLAKQS
ncbi:MAG: 16S rRNA (cytosine(967)-C(5))-methyltransferase RsmB [Candidatus Competibacteraceae bacterium]|jgi:16S rRNA (cytosine967-C5)-methyltransferase|nr:16S rRNA (cytosine(967)-C(5))-methyltransferase RsmB [Candidatus Competibacteraceae bacterium]